MMALAQVRVLGNPRPQGSKRAFVNRRTGKPIITEQTGENLRTWRNRLASAVAEVRVDGMPWEGPVRLAVTFFLSRPKKPKHRLLPASVPDLSKLLRAVEDELTGVWIRDDAQIVFVVAAKAWADESAPPGALIEVASA